MPTDNTSNVSSITSTANATTPSDVAEPAAPLSPLQFQDAFTSTAAIRAALAPSDLLPITLDVKVAATTVIGSIPRLAKLRPEMAKLPIIDLASIDALKTFGEALLFADIAYGAASAAGEALPKLVARAAELRDLLLSDANALAKRGLIDGTPLAGIKKSPGYFETAADVGILTRVLRTRWADIASKTGVQAPDLDEGDTIFERINLAIAGRNNLTTAADDAAKERQRAYTLMVDTYDQARRAVTFLRWDDNDLEVVTPSLWAGRARPAKGATDPHATTPAAAAPAANAPAPQPAIAAARPPTPDNVATTQAAPGHPGTSPFSSN